MNTAELARRLYAARQEGKATQPLTVEYPDLSLPEAYEIQARGLELALSQREALVGYKMGLTSLAKQRDVKVFEPIHGYLLGSYEILKGTAVRTEGRIHPRAEPEIAVVLKSELRGPNVTLRQVEAAIDLVLPAVEIIDSRYESFKFQLSDVIADNTSASGFILGRHCLKSQLNEVPLMGIIVKKNGEIVETGAAAAVLGDPLLSVVALANSLGAERKSLAPGMVILTGGITTSVTFGKGDLIEMIWPEETIGFKGA